MAFRLSMKPFVANPPEKGSFPLDHLGECSEAIRVFQECMRVNMNDSSSCRKESRLYLQCRMDNELMVRESMKNLGFHDANDDDGNKSDQSK